MNRIIKANIAHQSFDIDEKAYSTLKKYFDEVENYVRKELKAHEIMHKVEEGFAAQFTNAIKDGHKFISVNIVDEMIKQKGRPADLFKKQSPAQPQKNDSSYDKKLFRNPNDKFIGGVCGGLGVYVGINPNLLRLIWILLIPVAGFGIWVYIVLWVLIPNAKTPADIKQLQENQYSWTEVLEKLSDGLKKVLDSIIKPWRRNENKY
jgi:phage shock protein PspC (stress-responsive transcriptional regulator)